MSRSYARAPTGHLHNIPCDLAQLPNLGKTSVQWLQACGIQSQQQLRTTGAIQAFLKIKSRGFKPSLAQLYGLEGALRGIPWQQISASDKARLLKQLQARSTDNLS